MDDDAKEVGGKEKVERQRGKERKKEKKKGWMEQVDLWSQE